MQQLTKADGGGVFLGCVGGKGGQGTSMFAACLAGLCSRERKTILLDLDFNSTHRHVLDRDGGAGISNLAVVIEEITSLSAANIIQRHPLGFDLLPGMRNREEEHLLSHVKFNLIFKILAYEYDVIVLDISSNHRLISQGALSTCSLSFLILHPDLLSLRCAMRVLELGGRVEASSAISWGLIVNREKATGLVQPSQVSEVLELPLLAVLPEDPHAGEDFSNLLGKDPRCTQYLVALEHMAERLHLVRSPGSVPKRSLSSRCLHALRTLSGRPEEIMPEASSFLSGKGYSCAR
jgi:MinD-like ATPase involved in chromosome partitioning or flagellar assembly